MAIEHNGYKDCNLEKYKCFSCNNEFIVGTEMLNGNKPSCPYCKYGQTEKIVWTTDTELEEFNLGCLNLVKETTVE